MNKIKVLIVDDSAVVRQVLQAILETDPSIQVIGVASEVAHRRHDAFHAAMPRQ